MLSSLSWRHSSCCFVAIPSAFHCCSRSVQQQNGFEEDGWVHLQPWRAPRARPVACAGNSVGYVAGDAGAGAVVEGAAVVVVFVAV